MTGSSDTAAGRRTANMNGTSKARQQSAPSNGRQQKVECDDLPHGCTGHLVHAVARVEVGLEAGRMPRAVRAL